MVSDACVDRVCSCLCAGWRGDSFINCFLPQSYTRLTLLMKSFLPTSSVTFGFSGFYVCLSPHPGTGTPPPHPLFLTLNFDPGVLPWVTFSGPSADPRAPPRLVFRIHPWALCLQAIWTDLPIPDSPLQLLANWGVWTGAFPKNMPGWFKGITFQIVNIHITLSLVDPPEDGPEREILLLNFPFS